MKVALVCDWLTNVGGAEKVILEFHKLFPDAPIYTSQYRPKGINWFKDAEVRTGWLNRFPVKLRRFLGPLRQIFFSRLDLSEYDLVISITGAEAKAVRAKNGIHISYCHVPTQYYWQMYDDYIKNPGFGILNPFVRFFFRLLVVPLRHADLRAAQHPDYFVTISEYAKDQIKKYYGRSSTVIHPPVELDDFRLKGKQPPIHLKDDYELSHTYVVTSRQVNWKHVELAVRAAFLSQRHVLIIGEGPEHKKLVKMAKGSDLVQFLPLMKKEKLAKYLNQARGFLFPSLEPFGIAPVEALAAGCPVVAFGEGGAKDYVEPGKNGVLFPEQTPISLAEGILELEKLRLNREDISKTADAFSQARFDQEVTSFIEQCEAGVESPDPSLSPSSSSENTLVAKSEKTAETAKASQKAKPARSAKKAKSSSKSKPPKDSQDSAKPKKTKQSRKKHFHSKAQESIKKALTATKTSPKPAPKNSTAKTPATKTSTTKTATAKSSVTESTQKSSENTTKKPANPRAFPKIGEDVAFTRESVKKAEAAKEANRPKFPKIGKTS